MKLRNIFLALKGQLPIARAFRNFFITGNAWGMFSKYSHVRRDTDIPKVTYNTEKTAKRVAARMSKDYHKHFSYYKCVFCDGYHIGKNRKNK